MDTAKTLLRVPELIKGLQPFVAAPVKAHDIFVLIGEGRIKPSGYLQRIPLFEVSQIGEIARELRDDHRATVLAEVQA